MLYSKNKKGGFTLVELIVVLVILAILAALLIPALTGYIDKAKKDQVIAETRMLHEAIQTEMVEIYGSNVNWKTNGSTTIASKSNSEIRGSQSFSGSQSLSQRYAQVVKLSEVSSLQDGSGHFYAFINGSAKIHALIYDSGRGYIGAYFSDTQQYTAYKLNSSTDYGTISLDALAGYIDTIYYYAAFDRVMDPSSQDSAIIYMWSCPGIRGLLGIGKFDPYA